MTYDMLAPISNLFMPPSKGPLQVFLSGLYLGELIFGRAYIRNYTVYPLTLSGPQHIYWWYNFLSKNLSIKLEKNITGIGLASIAFQEAKILKGTPVSLWSSRDNDDLI